MKNTKTWLVQAIQHGPRKAVRRLNEEPNGFYACGLPQFNYNVRSSCARIKHGKLQIDVSYGGIDFALTTQGGRDFDERQWLDASEASSFIDPYGRSIYAD